jgi:hypothetical protein
MKPLNPQYVSVNEDPPKIHFNKNTITSGGNGVSTMNIEQFFAREINQLYDF